MNWALLIYSGHREEPPPEEAQPLLQEHRALQAEAAERILSIARLDAPDTARVVTRRDDDFALTDGPYLETHEWLVGFYLFQGTEAEAIAAGQRICPYRGHVEVRPVTWMPR